MSKTGHSNIAFVGDDGKGYVWWNFFANYSKKSSFFHFCLFLVNRSNKSKSYTIELSEKRPAKDAVVNSEKDNYDPYKSRVVEHPTT